jgi:5-methylcytosine-specific restriction endonuclease McrA
MQLLLNAIVNRNTEIAKKTLSVFNKKNIVQIIEPEFLHYDFHKDTLKVLKEISKVVKGKGIEYLENILCAKSIELPAIGDAIELGSTINNDIYLEMLRKYKSKKTHIPYSDKYVGEKNHAQNCLHILNQLNYIDNVKYEQKINKSKHNVTRNLLVKSVLSHQIHCFSCGTKIDADNITIDHLIAQDDRDDSAIIQTEDINNFFNLAKMCVNCNNTKSNYTLLKYHRIVKGFKFYPLNVLAILHLQKQEWLDKSNHKVVFEMEDKTHNYVQQYITKFTSVYKLEKAIEQIHDTVFSNFHITKSEFIKFCLLFK